MKYNRLMYATSCARRALLLLLVILSASVASSCDNMRGVETRTFALKELAPKDALQLIEGYVPGGTDNIRSSEVPAALTITAPRSRLDQVAQVLTTYDKPAVNSQLTFQVIEADGFTAKDPAIADVEDAIRGLFKFTGYKLVSSSTVIAAAPGAFSKALGDNMLIEGKITSAGGVDAVHLDLTLYKIFPIIKTSVIVPKGEAVVVGSTTPTAGERTLILVVRNQTK